MNLIRVSQWAIRIILIAAFTGILIVALLPGVDIESRIGSIGAALQIAGIAFALPELAYRLSHKPATDLIIWAETFMPLWKILGKIHIVKNLGQLSIVLSIIGVVLILVGLVMQYCTGYLG